MQQSGFPRMHPYVRFCKSGHIYMYVCVNELISTLTMMFLNQARAWFLEIDPVRNVCMCMCVSVCPPPRLLITSGVIWCDIDPTRLVK